MLSDPYALEIVTVPALDVFDNYYYLLHHTPSGRTVAIDCGRAQPVLNVLNARGWSLDEIWITHHHWDHVDGVEDLRKETGAKTIGAPEAAPNMPTLDIELRHNDSMEFEGYEVQVLHVPGHADGHVAFYLPQIHALFAGDCLMPLGCGRLLEGTPAQMWDSLKRLTSLPPETMIYSCHEYAIGNAAFAETLEQGNPALTKRIDTLRNLHARGVPTVPSRLQEELDTNPFLRAGHPALKAAVGRESASDVDVFAEIRRRKDAF